MNMIVFDFVFQTADSYVFVGVIKITFYVLNYQLTSSIN